MARTRRSNNGRASELGHVAAYGRMQAVSPDMSSGMELFARTTNAPLLSVTLPLEGSDSGSWLAGFFFGD